MAGMDSGGMLSAAESWELTVGTDTPGYQQALAKQLADAAHLQKQAAHILSLAEAAAQASEQAAMARRDLAQAIAQTREYIASMWSEACTASYGQREASCALAPAAPVWARGLLGRVGGESAR